MSLTFISWSEATLTSASWVTRKLGERGFPYPEKRSILTILFWLFGRRHGGWSYAFLITAFQSSHCGLRLPRECLFQIAWPPPAYSLWFSRWPPIPFGPDQQKGNQENFSQLSEQKKYTSPLWARIKETSRTEFRQQMRSGDLLVYLSLNCLFNGIAHVPDAILLKISPFLRNSTRVWRTDGPTDGPTDRRTDGRTDGRTDTPSYRDARTHLKTKW